MQPRLVSRDSRLELREGTLRLQTLVLGPQHPDMLACQTALAQIDEAAALCNKTQIGQTYKAARLRADLALLESDCEPQPFLHLRCLFPGSRLPWSE